MRAEAGVDIDAGEQLVDAIKPLAKSTRRPGAEASLGGFGARPLISGRLPNQPDVLVQWIINAPSLDPSTGMPPMPLTEHQARDVAAYLYTLDED